MLTPEAPEAERLDADNLPDCKSTELFLRLYFQRAVHHAALCGLVATVACADSHKSARTDGSNAAAGSPDASLLEPAFDAATRADASSAEAGGPGALTLDAAALDSSVFDDAETPPLADTGTSADVVTVPFMERSAIPGDAGPDSGWMVPDCGVFTTAEMQIDPGHLAVAVDYVAVRRTDPSQTTIAGEGGKACASAQNQSSCSEMLNAAGRSLLPAGATCSLYCPFEHYAVTTQGDLVKVWHTDAEIRTLLGEIDSPSEALALLFTQRIRVGCDMTNAAYRVVPGGYEVRRWEQIGSCPPTYQQGYVTRFIARDGSVTITAQEVVSSNNGCPVAGRRPEGLCFSEREAGTRSALGAYFARAAALEAASVPALETLEKELRALHAPEALLGSVRAAIVDEHDHAARMGRLAQRFGATPDQPEIPTRALRDPFALALDNAVEGCVRESFGALLATFQAAHAQPGDVRATFACIARDETRHAALAFQIHAWLEPRLTPAQRAAVAKSRDAALRVLCAELAGSRDVSLEEVLGLPSAEQCELLLAQLPGLWSDGAPGRVEPGDLVDAALKQSHDDFVLASLA
jgi:hypothetical protein